MAFDLGHYEMSRDSVRNKLNSNTKALWFTDLGDIT